jgi:hypothetical protein
MYILVLIAPEYIEDKNGFLIPKKYTIKKRVARI